MRKSNDKHASLIYLFLTWKLRNTLELFCYIYLYCFIHKGIEIFGSVYPSKQSNKYFFFPFWYIIFICQNSFLVCWIKLHPKFATDILWERKFIENDKNLANPGLEGLCFK